VKEDSIFNEIKELVSFAKKEGIYELEFREGKRRISFKRRPLKKRGSKEKSVEKKEPNFPYEDIKSPLNGIFYRRPSPKEPCFVEVGDKVEEGQVIGLIEAMKVFNEIKAETSGIIKEIVAEDGGLVRVGDVLMRLERI
jgi:biotin carboxyl carrier protein